MVPPQPLAPSAAYDPLEKILWAPLFVTVQIFGLIVTPSVVKLCTRLYASLPGY